MTLVLTLLEQNFKIALKICYWGKINLENFIKEIENSLLNGNFTMEKCILKYLEAGLNGRKYMSEERYSKFEDRLTVIISSNLKKRKKNWIREKKCLKLSEPLAQVKYISSMGFDHSFNYIWVIKVPKESIWEDWANKFWIIAEYP